MDDLDEVLAAMGFRRSGSRNPGWTKQTTPYLVYAVHGQEDGTVLFTWELAIGELMGHLGLQIGANDPLNLFLFPQHDSLGPATAAFVVSEIERTEAILKAVDLATAG
ncbi:MAG: hypothetical protein ACRDJM_05310 [Actinomycetota bacterium]